MTAQTGPLNHGQLSQLRDDESLPPAGRHQPNVGRAMPLPDGVPVARLREAMRRLAVRHPALRTTYLLDDPARLRQVVHPADAVVVDLPEVAVPAGADAGAFAEEHTETLKRQVFDLTRELPWRAAVITREGRPTHLVTVIHHIAADLWSEGLLGRDLGALLAGGEPTGPVDCPLDLALAQHSARGRAAQQATERYLREVYTAAASAVVPDVVAAPMVRVNAVLDSRIAVTGAARRAAELRATVPSLSVPGLILAAYAWTVHGTMGVADLMISSLVNNRLQPGSAELVGNMVQWARVISHRDPGQSFEAYAGELHHATLEAYRHGCYDVDLDSRVRHEVEETVGPIRFEINYNYAQYEPEPLPADAPPWRIRKVPAPYYGGPGFYLVAYLGSSHLELTGRTRWQGLRHAEMETFLSDVHELLQPTGGGANRPA